MCSTNPVHEVPVVADHNQASGKIEEEFLEDLQGVNVEVVRRLVEDQEIGVGHQHLQEVQALSLATAQR